MLVELECIERASTLAGAQRSFCGLAECHSPKVDVAVDQNRTGGPWLTTKNEENRLTTKKVNPPGFRKWAC